MHDSGSETGSVSAREYSYRMHPRLISPPTEKWHVFINLRYFSAIDMSQRP